jgi:hypothetical protein
MADETPTRSETVAANIAEIIEKYGTFNCTQMQTQCLMDISISLAALVDAGSND